MLIIRHAQMEAFAKASCRRWIVEHLTTFFPEECALLPPTELHECIVAGEQAANRHGFTTGAEVCQYLDLTFVLGEDFDTNADLPWAGDILRDHSSAGADTRLKRLQATTLAYLREKE